MIVIIGGPASCRLKRRFPPPWSAEEQSACFVVRDANGQQVAYVYYESELCGDCNQNYCKRASKRLSEWIVIAQSDRLTQVIVILRCFEIAFA